MKIHDIFRHPIERRIEEVIKVDLADEETVALELEEYVVTEHIRRSFEQLLDHFQETINKPSEATTIWISGFFGSGKSSFAKILGYLLENPVVLGRTAVERFLERIDDPRIQALLATIHSTAPTFSVLVDLASGKNVAREGESIVLPLYRAVLERLDYSRDFALAELEFDLESDGDLEAFEEAFDKVSGMRGGWRSRRHIGLARNEASHALHLLRPATYPSPDTWARSPRQPEINADWFAHRILEMLRRRASRVRRIAFVVDEVGQYVARSVDRMFDLMGLAHAVQKKRGEIWIAVTSQETLEDVVDSLEGRQVELARVRDRFPNRVDLIPRDIEEVAGRRVLQKNAEGQEAVRSAHRVHRNKLEANTRLDSPIRNREFSEEEFIRIYPLLPYQIQLFIDAVSAHRSRGGAAPMLGGSNRTIIKLAQQLVVDQKSGLGEREVGALATVDMAYDLLESIFPTAWRAEIEGVAARHESGGLPTKVAKAIALLTGVTALKLNATNLAAVLHPSVGAEGLREQVADALMILSSEEVLRQTDEGYKLQSPEEKSWEKERHGIEMRPAAFARIRRETIKQLLGGLVVEAGRAFRVGVTVDGEHVVEGDISLAIVEKDLAGLDDVRSRSREANASATAFVAYDHGGDTYETALELHRSAEMVKRKENAAKSAADVELLGEERMRLARFEKLLAERLSRDLLAGITFFRGVDCPLRGAEPRAALREFLAARVEEIYPLLEQFNAPVRRGDGILVLREDKLDGLPDYLRDAGLGIVRTTPRGVEFALDRDPLAAVVREISDRANYGREPAGKYLEEKFGAPPYGAIVEVIQVLVAAALRAGAVEAIYQGARIANPKDARLDKVFTTLPGFRAATFVPQRELDVEIRARVARRLSEMTGERESVATDALAGRIRDAFKTDAEISGRVAASFRALGLRVPEGVQHVREIAASYTISTDEEVIKTSDETWSDLVEGRDLARRLDAVLDEAALEILRDAQAQLQRGAAGLTSDAQEQLNQLADLLRATDIAGQMGAIRRLLTTVRQIRAAAWEAAAIELRRRVAEEAERIRTRDFGRVEEATVEEVLRPLLELAPSEAANAESGPDLEVLRSRLASVDAITDRVRAQIEELASRVEIVRIRVRDLFGGVVTSEEELGTLLDRIRKAAEEALSLGKHFSLS